MEQANELENVDKADVWPIILENQYAAAIPYMISVLQEIPVEDFANAIGRIQKAESVGPILLPHLYQDGRRFENARQYIALLRDLKKLRETIAEIMPENESREMDTADDG